MGTSSKAVKKTALTAMKGNGIGFIVPAMVFTFIVLCCFILPELFLFANNLKFLYPIVSFILMVFLVLPLFLGVLRLFWRKFLGSKELTGAVFYYFSDKLLYCKVLKLISKLGMRMLWFGIIFFLPYFATMILSSAKTYELFGLEMPSFLSNIWIISNFFKLSAILLLVRVMLRSYLVPFLIVADEDMETEEAIHLSQIISANSRLDFLILIISFLPWIILTFFCIPTVFTVPYMFMAYIVHCRFVTAKYNRAVEEMNRNDTPTFAADF